MEGTDHPLALLMAVFGTLVFVGILAKALLSVGPRTATVLGVSMVPRAEIAMVVMQRGVTMADSGIPRHVYSAMVLVSAATCLGAPLVLRVLFRRWPETVE